MSAITMVLSCQHWILSLNDRLPEIGHGEQFCDTHWACFLTTETSSEFARHFYLRGHWRRQLRGTGYVPPPLIAIIFQCTLTYTIRYGIFTCAQKLTMSTVSCLVKHKVTFVTLLAPIPGDATVRGNRSYCSACVTSVFCMCDEICAGRQAGVTEWALTENRVLFSTAEQVILDRRIVVHRVWLWNVLHSSSLWLIFSSYFWIYY